MTQLGNYETEVRVDYYRLVVVMGRLPSQNCGLGPTVLSPGDSYVDLVDEIG
jgi:hypothetical protein